jgi:hypothetical protein
MENNWNEDTIYKDLELLINLRDNYSQNNKRMLEKDISLLNTFLGEDSDDNQQPSDFIFDNKAILNEYKNTLPYLKAFSTLINKKEIKDKCYTLNRTYINNNDVFTLMHDFYKTLDKDIYNAFMINFKNHQHNFKFITTPLNNNLGAFAGLTFPIAYLKKCYIQSLDNNTIEKLMYATHEEAHAMAKTINNYHYIKELYNEVESIFIELIAIDYYKEILAKEDFNKYQFNYLKEMLISAKYVTDINTTYNNINQIMNGQNCNLPNLKLITEMDKYITGEIIYPYCYLIAVELYELYKLDPEKALIKYKRIISSKNIFLKRELIVHPAQNIKIYTNETIKLNKKKDHC